MRAGLWVTEMQPQVPIRLRSGQAFDSPPLRFGSLRMTIFKLVATPTMEQPLFCGRNTDGGCTEVRPP
jgi:hypothetical protein